MEGLLTSCACSQAPCPHRGCGWLERLVRAAGFQPRVLGRPFASRLPGPQPVSLLQGWAEVRVRGAAGTSEREDCAPRCQGTPRPVDCALCASLLSCALDYDEDRTEGGREPGWALVTGACTARAVPVLVFMWQACGLGTVAPHRVTAGAAEAQECSLRLHPGLTAGPGSQAMAAVSCMLCCVSTLCSAVLLGCAFSRVTLSFQGGGLAKGCPGREPFSAGTLTYPEKVRWLSIPRTRRRLSKENGSLWWEQFNSPFICCFPRKGWHFPLKGFTRHSCVVSSACRSAMPRPAKTPLPSESSSLCQSTNPGGPLSFWEMHLWFQVVYLVSSSSVIAEGMTAQCLPHQG